MNNHYRVLRIRGSAEESVSRAFACVGIDTYYRMAIRIYGSVVPAFVGYLFVPAVFPTLPEQVMIYGRNI